MLVSPPPTCRFRDITESAENLPKSEKMKFRQVGGTGTGATAFGSSKCVLSIPR